MGKTNPNRLRVLRAERRMTQLALAKKSRLNVGTLSLIENGHIEPTSSQRDRLARALRVEVETAFPAPEQEQVAS